MFKVISMILCPAPESAEPEEMEAVRDRMARMRARTTSQNLQALKLPETESDSSSSSDAQEITRTDIISRGRDIDPSRSSGAFTFRGKEERARRMGSLVRDWHDRVSHLPGFEVDPRISQE